MLAEEGYARDIEVVKLIRRHVGPDILLGVDCQRRLRPGADQAVRAATPPTASWRSSRRCSRSPSPEYQALKAFMRENGWNILIADGENKRFPRDMKSWVEAEAVDILQGDMNQFGFEDILAEADMARPHKAMVAPHNWGSLFGYYLQLHVGRAHRQLLPGRAGPDDLPGGGGRRVRHQGWQGPRARNPGPRA